MTPSKLTPYQTMIASLRKEGTSYREIVKILQDRHGVTVGRNTVHSFVKVRSKRPRKVYTMLEDQASSPVGLPNLNKTTVGLQRSKLVPGSKDTEAPRRPVFNYTIF